MVPSSSATAVKARPSWYVYDCNLSPASTHPQPISNGERARPSKRKHTQYIKTQYQHSTRNGNLFSRRLRSLSRKTTVFGDVTAFDHPKSPTRRLRHRPSSSCGITGKEYRGLSDPAFEAGLHRPGSRGSGEAMRQSSSDLRRVHGLRDQRSEDRLIQVPPKRRTMTTRGSRNAPMPMVALSGPKAQWR